MHDLDSTLAEDFDWALFPQDEHLVSPVRRWFRRLEVGLVVVLTWVVCQPLAVVLACLAFSFQDFRKAGVSSRMTPDPSASRICWLFGCAWGMWKVGATGFASMFAVIAQVGANPDDRRIPPAFVAAIVLWLAGFGASAALTAAGLAKAFRSEMRVWIGQGINQARTLLMCMLIAGFALLVMMPTFVFLPGMLPRPADKPGSGLLFMTGFLGCLFGAPITILVILDFLARRIVAAHPGKFGPKVASVGKGPS